jgi:hypothetical protein
LKDQDFTHVRITRRKRKMTAVDCVKIIMNYEKIPAETRLDLIEKIMDAAIKGKSDIQIPAACQRKVTK